MNDIKSEVLTTVSRRNILTGNPLPSIVVSTCGEISSGMMTRLHRYAVACLMEHGLSDAVCGWEVNIYTLDGHLPSADRSYTIRFKNSVGGYIEVVGVATLKGWPMLNHGIEVGIEK